MTSEEIETFIRCIGKLSDGWDARIIVSAYQHLAIDDAISAFVKDLHCYTKNKEEGKKALPESKAISSQKSTTIYDISQASIKLN